MLETGVACGRRNKDPNNVGASTTKFELESENLKYGGHLMLEFVKLPCKVQTTKGLTNHATLDGLSNWSAHAC